MAFVLAIPLAAPADADPANRGVAGKSADAVSSAAGRVWQRVTGFGPATINGLILYSGRFGGNTHVVGPEGRIAQPLRIGAVGPVSTNDRWRCGTTVNGARIYATGFTETAATQKLLPYAKSRFHCRRLNRGSLLKD
ncbi:MAG: hypothetical protein HKN60_07360 [Rhizobiales bacterium]|nr:hypothetical protein [Hyphomicrobiales bacterium]